MANIPNTDSKLVWVKAMARGQCFPLDATELWSALGDEVNPVEGTARYYAANDPTAYVGQTLKVIENNTVSVYVIGDSNGTLIHLNAGDNEIDVGALSDEEILEVFNEVFAE